MQTRSKTLIYESLIIILVHIYLRSKFEMKFKMVAWYVRKLQFSQVPSKYLH